MVIGESCSYPKKANDNKIVAWGEIAREDSVGRLRIKKKKLKCNK